MGDVSGLGVLRLRAARFAQNDGSFFYGMAVPELSLMKTMKF